MFMTPFRGFDFLVARTGIGVARRGAWGGLCDRVSSPVAQHATAL